MAPTVDRDVSNTAVRILLEHVEEVAGHQGVDDVLARAGEARPLPILLDDTEWSSYAQFRRLLEATAQRLGGLEGIHGIGRDKTEFDGGNMPRNVQALHDLGDPKELLAQVASGHNLLLPVAETAGEDAGPHAWVTRQRLRGGFEPFPELCAFMVGIAPLAARLYGYRHVDVVEETCQRRGDDWCSVRISWTPPDEHERQLHQLRHRLKLVERQHDAFRDTVADLVRATDVETVLEHILHAAATTVRATGFVLAIEPLPAVRGTCWHRGLDADEAAAVAEGLLAGRAVEGVRTVIEVRSPRRAYGWLAAYDPTQIDIEAPDALRSYVDVAAMALDGAVDRWESRTEARRTRTLLQLAEAMVAATTTEGVAAALAAAVPAVVGADRAIVVAFDEPASMRILAAEGYGALGDALVGQEFPPDEGLPLEITYVTPQMGSEQRQALMAASGSVAAVYVPVRVDGRPAALLIATVADDADRLAPNAQLELSLQGLAALAATGWERARLIDQIRHEAEHDSLTGLPNRSAIVARVERLLASHEPPERAVVALYVDLDGFKEVNDAHGHAAGDALLRAAAMRFRTVLRGGDVVGRIGGDEFVVLLDEGDRSAEPIAIADRLIAAASEPFGLEGVAEPVRLSASVGIAVADGHGTASELLRDADAALYLAKRSGKGRAVVHERAQTSSSNTPVTRS